MVASVNLTRRNKGEKLNSNLCAFEEYHVNVDDPPTSRRKTETQVGAQTKELTQHHQTPKEETNYPYALAPI